MRKAVGGRFLRSILRIPFPRKSGSVGPAQTQPRARRAVCASAAARPQLCTLHGARACASRPRAKPSWDHPQASRRRTSLPRAHETQHASSFQVSPGTPARMHTKRTTPHLFRGSWVLRPHETQGRTRCPEKPVCPQQAHKRRSGGGSSFFMRDGNLSSGEIKTRAAFLRRILRHNRLSRDAHLRRILRHSRLLGAVRITQYTAHTSCRRAIFYALYCVITFPGRPSYAVYCAFSRLLGKASLRSILRIAFLP